MSPLAFTAKWAATTRSPELQDAEPIPPTFEYSLPLHFDTVAPVPAPIAPISVLVDEADSAASLPSLAQGRLDGSPSLRSKK